MTLIPDLQRDLVDAAERMKGGRQRFRMLLRAVSAVVVAAALIGAAVLLLDGGGFDTAPSSREPAASPQDSSPRTPPERPPEPPPRRGPQPVPGSLSQAVRFEFAGAGYSIVGFQARSGVICTRLVERRGGSSRRLVGATCAGERLLRRELPDHPARLVGTGGGPPVQIGGFARADVARIAVLDSQYPSRVVLSKPWSPEPWQGEAIRFFLVLIDASLERTPGVPLPDGLRLEARLTSGELVNVVP
jgi:hypothetical protein